MERKDNCLKFSVLLACFPNYIVWTFLNVFLTYKSFKTGEQQFRCRSLHF